jgi:vacuolar protein 8
VRNHYRYFYPWLSSPIAENKLLIVKLGGLEPLIRQMLSPNVEVQCNAVGCVTNLATHGMSSANSAFRTLISADDNKTKIAKSGALVPLTRLARSKDMRVQRNATGALLNMTHSGVLLIAILLNI